MRWKCAVSVVSKVIAIALARPGIRLTRADNNIADKEHHE
jgi:hypothetical protein